MTARVRALARLSQSDNATLGRMTSRTRLLILAALCASIVAAGLPSAASASSIAYVGTDGNVWVTSPDGANKKRVTTDGTTASGGSYNNPSQTDDGRILSSKGQFMFVHRFDGTRVWSWQPPYGGSFYKSVLSQHFSPEGGLITWSYTHSAHAYDPIRQRVSFQTPDGGTTSPCLINCHDGYSHSRWVHTTGKAAMISTDGSTIAVQGTSSPQPWAASNGRDFEGFDISRDGKKTLVQTTPDGVGTGEQGVLEFFQGNIPPGAQSGVCAVYLGDETTQPRWSPDGSQITWSDAEGVWASRAPSAGGNGACNLNPTLIVPGGKQPDFGKTDVPAPPAGGGGTTDPGGGTTNPGGGTSNPGGGSSNPGGGDTSTPGGGGTTEPGGGTQTDVGGDQDTPEQRDTVAPAISGVKPIAGKLARLLAKGYAVSFKSDESGTATIEVLNGRKIVATARRQVAAGATSKVVAKFTKKARKQLKRKKRVKLSVRVVVADAAGNSSMQVKRVTLKR